MLIGEPARTQADINFSLFGFRVRVHPFFWLIALVLGMGGRGKADPVETVLWMVVMFVSIVVHELGHAFAIRKYGGDCWITLYGFGGLASSNWVDRTPRQQILVSAAGPAAGFLLAALVLAGVHLAGHNVRFVPDVVPVRFDLFANQHLTLLVWYLLVINILWGFLNLLPIYPLDGGQIAREILVQQNPGRGVIQSLWLSVFTGGCLAIFGLVYADSFFMAIMFGLLAYSSYTTIQAYTGRGTGRGW